MRRLPLALPALLPAPALAEEAGSTLMEPLAGGRILEILLGLFAVLVFIGVVAWLVRRMPGLTRSADGSLRVVAGIPVGQRERILLVEVGGEQIVVGVAPGRVELLHHLAEPVSSTTKGDEGSDFAHRLQERLQRLRSRK
ncbi:MAG: flagellar biosynthetic protein FliO [Thiohalospira sp.]|uniref:flagellar biosynthetic protein FliO n=1 Tax=Thiohalospira sp. TaxID=3080549 RepID=UPI0039816C61